MFLFVNKVRIFFVFQAFISVDLRNLILDTDFSLEIKHCSMLHKAINQKYGLPLRKAR